MQKKIYGLAVALGLSLFQISCNLTKDPAPSTSTTQNVKISQGQSSQTVPEAAKLSCADGKPPKAFAGTCTGAWKISTKEGRNICVFDWGPPVKCPQGTVALGYQAVCYGSTEKASQKRALNSAKDCSDEFGVTPLIPAYKLNCCYP